VLIIIKCHSSVPNKNFGVFYFNVNIRLPNNPGTCGRKRNVSGCKIARGEIINADRRTFTLFEKFDNYKRAKNGF
jgi:hypothetical protein